MKVFLILLCYLYFNPSDNNYDCVWGAKDKTSYRVLETGYGAKVYFSGGYGSAFIVKLDGSLYTRTFDQVYFVKDEFCDYEDDVLVIDDEVFGVQTVSKVD
jgi:hypothetical protein